MNKYRVIGIMSGTSLDGLDIAYCEFIYNDSIGWKYKIIHAETIKYSREWRNRLNKAFKTGKNTLQKQDIQYGRFIGREILKFIKHKRIKVDFISSHGHTVFHQPENKFTLQIGNGQGIASVCRLPVVCDFRSSDVALGGQGAPLVPIVDKMLFSQYTFCLNLGGFANISFDNVQYKRLAFDICPVNIILNHLARMLDKEFDKEGKISSCGKVHETLLNKLNALSFYRMKPPKSLGREWAEKTFFPILHSFNIPVQDKMRTVVEHIAVQIAAAVNPAADKSRKNHSQNDIKLFITGGGAYNRFLMARMAAYLKCSVILPDDKTIQFKEAMAFAFLGVLRMKGETNILKSVTGAKQNSSSGKIYLPDQKF